MFRYRSDCSRRVWACALVAAVYALAGVSQAKPPTFHVNYDIATRYDGRQNALRGTARVANEVPHVIQTETLLIGITIAFVSCDKYEATVTLTPLAPPTDGIAGLPLASAGGQAQYRTPFNFTNANDRAALDAAIATSLLTDDRGCR